MISVFDVTHFRSNHHDQSFWDALARHVAQKYDADSYKTVAMRQFILEYRKSVSNRCELSKYVHDYYSQLIKSKEEINVNIFHNKEVISFIATYLNCVFIIAQVVTNGLGYMLTDAILGEKVIHDEQPAYYVFISVDEDRFDTLHVRSYEVDLDGSRELLHKTAIDDVVYTWLTGFVAVPNHDHSDGSISLQDDAVAYPVGTNTLFL